MIFLGQIQNIKMNLLLKNVHDKNKYKQGNQYNYL